MRRNGLPEDAPYSTDGYSVPMEYFKYDPDWRRLVREFQEDLGAGRYDPEWQKQAIRAMEERARGDFDDYKDGQFEEFWGQKQKVHHLDRAGDSAQIKLEEMVSHGFIKEGDIFSYARVIGRSEERILIEKDMRVVQVAGCVLTMGIPPGRLKYARHLPTPQTTPKKPAKTRFSESQRESAQESIDHGHHEASRPPINGSGPPLGLTNGNNKMINGTGADSESAQDAGAEVAVITRVPEKQIDVTTGTEARAEYMNPTLAESSSSPTTPMKHARVEKPPSSSQAPVEDVILVHIKTLNELNNRIVEIDGRLDHTVPRAASVWRLIRVKRDNQDLGSLFEMRDDFFVRQSPTIVKMPQTTRTGRQIRSKKKD